MQRKIIGADFSDFAVRLSAKLAQAAQGHFGSQKLEDGLKQVQKYEYEKHIIQYEYEIHIHIHINIYIYITYEYEYEIHIYINKENFRPQPKVEDGLKQVYKRKNL